MNKVGKVFSLESMLGIERVGVQRDHRHALATLYDTLSLIVRPLHFSKPFPVPEAAY